MKDGILKLGRFGSFYPWDCLAIRGTNPDSTDSWFSLLWFRPKAGLGSIRGSFPFYSSHSSHSWFRTSFPGLTNRIRIIRLIRGFGCCQRPRWEIRGFQFVALTQIDNARSVTRNRRIVGHCIFSGAHRVLCISPSFPNPRQSLLTTVSAPARIPPPSPAVSLAAPVLHRPSTCEQSRQLRCARWRCRSPYTARTRWFEEKW